MNDTKVQYAAFKIYSPKHDVSVEISCAPGEISNYFETTNLPWEISPAFFRADVLNKYRADTQNCELVEDYLVYRDDWDLKRYGINEKGLIWTYVRYLWLTAARLIMFEVATLVSSPQKRPLWLGTDHLCCPFGKRWR